MRRVIYCFWFGDKMSDNRKRCFDSIVLNSGVDVELVTEKTLKNYIVTPLHNGFEYLSATHKSDYLRSYFMYFYGGGYTDIKNCDFDWSPFFTELENGDKDFVGSREICEKDIGYKPVAKYFNQLVGCCGFIFKDHSNFANLWYVETQKKMDSIYSQLFDNPGLYHPRAITGGVQGEKGIYLSSQYPLKWNELLGEIFHKIQYENLGSYLSTLPPPNTREYR